MPRIPTPPTKKSSSSFWSTKSSTTTSSSNSSNNKQGSSSSALLQLLQATNTNSKNNNSNKQQQQQPKQDPPKPEPQKPSSLTKLQGITSSSSTTSSTSRMYLLTRFLILGMVLAFPVAKFCDMRKLLAQVVEGVQNSTDPTRHVTLVRSTLGTVTLQQPTRRKPPMLPLTELLQSHRPAPNCTFPYVPVMDRIVDDPYDTANGGRKIPRQLHIAWISDDKTGKDERCLHYQQAVGVDRWKQAMPHYSIYFHTNHAVDTLIQQANWPEFPHLQHILKCFTMKSAMLIDLWRMLVLYQYGGMYTDMDVHPGQLMNEAVIPAEADFFSLSDSWNRPSQWMFAVSPGHPVMYFTLHEILNRVWALADITRPNLVFTTGPDALKHGYGRCFYWKKDVIFGDGTFKGQYNTTARKIGFASMEKYMTQNINNMTVVNGVNMTVRQQLKLETGLGHWVDEANKIPSQMTPISCMDYLYQWEQDQTNSFPHPPSNHYTRETTEQQSSKQNQRRAVNLPVTRISYSNHNNNVDTPPVQQ